MDLQYLSGINQQPVNDKGKNQEILYHLVLKQLQQFMTRPAKGGQPKSFTFSNLRILIKGSGQQDGACCISIYGIGEAGGTLRGHSTAGRHVQMHQRTFAFARHL